jgi:hypothetical protein
MFLEVCKERRFDLKEGGKCKIKQSKLNFFLLGFKIIGGKTGIQEKTTLTPRTR